MLPRPIIPNVFPERDVPESLGQPPLLVLLFPSGIFLAAEMASPIVSSATDAEFAPGVLVTKIPAFFATSRSTLSTPVP